MRVSFERATGLGVPQARPLVALCLGAAVALTVGCGQKDSAKGAPGLPPGGMPVQVQVVKNDTIADTTEYLSVLKSRHSANINPQVEGQITKIFVKSGDRVKTGQPLLEIDPTLTNLNIKGMAATQDGELLILDAAAPRVLRFRLN